MTVISWLTDVWARTHVVRILDGGEDAGPLADRAILAELRNPSTIEAARKLTTTGRFTENICRCPGDTTIALHDDSDELVTAASLHGYGNISWERDTCTTTYTSQIPPHCTCSWPPRASLIRSRCSWHH
ncbi:hypothetical protein JQN83_11165 [Micromonospora sp. MMS20-R2-23]|uniref:Uncharacterized protein n=1 Tax=Micromonospora antibiotica TaxID=2807623 RepID=A0ABS3V6X4_9ACTN|nr:hypothetical protein [Micromonospora antibiotica]